MQGYAVDRSDDSDLTLTKLRWKALQGSREPWVGPTCSMCHTSHISYQGTQLTVYGGQTMGDLAGFQLEILGALQSTRADTAKFERFARKVLGADGLVSGYNDANKARLQAALDATIVRLRDGSHFNLPHDPEFGPAAWTPSVSIFNSVGYELHADEQIYGAEDAPVSYPFLWNVPQLDRVQWTGFNPNHINVVEIDNRKFDVGALARNAGEAVGVFADVKVLSPIQSALHIGYPSSINVDNLIRIEDQLGQLKPPAWLNQLFGAPESTRVAEGRELYRQHCSSCHTPLDRNDLRTPVKTVLTHSAGARRGRADRHRPVDRLQQHRPAEDRLRARQALPVLRRHRPARFLRQAGPCGGRAPGSGGPGPGRARPERRPGCLPDRRPGHLRRAVAAADQSGAGQPRRRQRRSDRRGRARRPAPGRKRRGRQRQAPGAWSSAWR